jgi:hypothetical protein
MVTDDAGPETDRLSAGARAAGDQLLRISCGATELPAPKVVEAIVTGIQSFDLDAKKLLGLSDLPLGWDEQEKLLLDK